MTNSSAYPEKDVALLGNQVEIDVALLPGVPNQRGPRGPQGLPGKDGVQITQIPALVAYSHNQLAASNFWIITHNLNFRPNVTAFDSAGDMVEGNVIHNSANQLTLQFSSPISGTAQLS